MGQRRAARVAWELKHQRKLGRRWALHSCDYPPCVRHLFAGNHRRNMADAAAKGRMPGGSCRGEAHPDAKLTERDVLMIRARYAAGGVRQIDLAHEYHVPQAHVSRIILRKTWRHVA